jgi:hypothetical protein
MSITFPCWLVLVLLSLRWTVARSCVAVGLDAERARAVFGRGGVWESGCANMCLSGIRDDSCETGGLMDLSAVEFEALAFCHCCGWVYA